jgi:hypothetical protein
VVALANVALAKDSVIVPGDAAVLSEPPAGPIDDLTMFVPPAQAPFGVELGTGVGEPPVGLGVAVGEAVGFGVALGFEVGEPLTTGVGVAPPPPVLIGATGVPWFPPLHAVSSAAAERTANAPLCNFDDVKKRI